MLKVFKYKLQPNRKQCLALQHTLDICRDVFNLPEFILGASIFNSNTQPIELINKKYYKF